MECSKPKKWENLTVSNVNKYKQQREHAGCYWESNLAQMTGNQFGTWELGVSLKEKQLHKAP